ncbi:MAG: 23S rRNA (uridine(2552)-2'-O)-methyltransferase [Halobacteriales archaeon]|nr:23S rRNA (uridine(2552)-2'-O)-methyltransferase [Halobacteriales archaeon]
MSQKDHYYNKSKQEGYRSRAAYKLKQLDETFSLIKPDATVVDLGAAPGGWLQVAAERTPEGRVLGVDLQRIETTDLDNVETIRGNITEADTQSAITERVGAADVVLSDMAPNVTGEYELDHARSVHLARQAFTVATEVLADGGHFVVKAFEGPDLADLRSDIDQEFDFVKTTQPDATRESSSELYIVAKKRLTAPVRTGDRLEVTIETIGDEGDGIAHVDGFTLFVPSTEEGETVEIRVEDVKPRFGFAQRID